MANNKHSQFLPAAAALTAILAVALFDFYASNSMRDEVTALENMLAFLEAPPGRHAPPPATPTEPPAIVLPRPETRPDEFVELERRVAALESAPRVEPAKLRRQDESGALKERLSDLEERLSKVLRRLEDFEKAMGSGQAELSRTGRQTESLADGLFYKVNKLETDFSNLQLELARLKLKDR